MKGQQNQTKLVKESQWYFYFRDRYRNVVPVRNEKVNQKAKKILTKICKRYKSELPKYFQDNWSEVKLFETKGSLDDAHSLVINSDNGFYDLNNKLNHMTGKEWTIFSCSWFIFNALPSDLKEEKGICKNSENHPATYSPTMMEHFIKFFTKEGMSVLDPFAGIGSTLVGCKRTNRVGYGIELNERYHETIVKRVPEFKSNVVLGDSRNVKKYFNGKKFNFCISSPPYWDVLNRSTADFREKRKTKGLDSNYSERKLDLGNIDNYELFVKHLIQIYIDIYDLLEKGSYLVIIVKNVKKSGKFYPLAWDIAKELSNKYELKDEKIWIQDKIGLAPYGYPYSWSANILHHYCIIMRKENG